MSMVVNLRFKKGQRKRWMCDHTRKYKFLLISEDMLV